MNHCIVDSCTSDESCSGGANQPTICAPAGAFGYPARRCFAALCHTNADCVDEPGGVCAPVAAPCCAVPSGLACVYPGGCRVDGDCSHDGSSHCEIDAAKKAGVCVMGPAACPV
jgi:hypothetical protein